MSKERKFPKLFITDLDGTALGGSSQPYARFPDSFSVFLDRLVMNNCSWATNTTWDVKQQQQLFYSSAAVSRPSYMIGGTSSQLCVMIDDEIEKVQPYSSLTEKMLDAAHHIHTFPLIRDVCSRFNSSSMYFNGYWFGMTAPDNEVEQLFRYIGEIYKHNNELNLVIIPEEKRFYVHPIFLRKGTAIKEIMRITGLRPDDIVVAGDEIMDLDMMNPDISEHVICPNNAHVEVKKRVLEMNGFVGDTDYSTGVIEGFLKLAEVRGWTWLE